MHDNVKKCISFFPIQILPRILICVKITYYHPVFYKFSKILQDLDQKRSEIAELGRTKEKLSSRVEELEVQIADLQEQVIF